MTGMEGFYLLSWDGNGTFTGYSPVTVRGARFDADPWVFLADRSDWRAWVEDFRLRRGRRFQRAFPLSPREFRGEVRAAIDSMPSSIPLGQLGFSVLDEEEESALYPTEWGRDEFRDFRDFTSTFGRYWWWPMEAHTPLLAKIELYRLPILRNSASLEGVRARIRATVVHEVAHHVGFGEARVRELEAEAQRAVWRLNRAAVLGLRDGNDRI